MNITNKNTSTNNIYYLVPKINIINTDELQVSIKQFTENYKTITNKDPPNEITRQFNQLVVSDNELNDTFKLVIEDNIDKEFRSSIIELGKNLLQLQKTIIELTYNKIYEKVPDKKLQGQLKLIFTALSKKAQTLDNILKEKEKENKI
jgi:hypothetical protein